MTELKTLLEIRNEIKERKPDFIRQDNPKRMKVNYKWRKPKGIHSKIRHKFKGRRKMPSPGYKSPIKVKGLHSSGLEIINIYSIKDISQIKKESQGIVIAKTIGMKKQFEILKKAKELGIKVLNLNVDGQIKKIEDIINSKKKKDAKEKKAEVKEEKKPKETKKEEIKKEAKTKESKENISEKKSEEDRKESNASERRTRSQLTEKKEKDKLLTKKV